MGLRLVQLPLQSHQGDTGLYSGIYLILHICQIHLEEHISAEHHISYRWPYLVISPANVRICKFLSPGTPPAFSFGYCLIIVFLDPETCLQFWLTSSFNVGGFMLTLLFMPEPLRVSLAEVDRRWHCIQQGRPYYGEAINPKNLSYYENLTGQAKVGKGLTIFSAYAESDAPPTLTQNHPQAYDKARDEEDRWNEGLAAAQDGNGNGKAKAGVV